MALRMPAHEALPGVSSGGHAIVPELRRAKVKGKMRGRHKVQALGLAPALTHTVGSSCETCRLP
jgi:hypothetical protein